jgi:hypothetical protein
VAATGAEAGAVVAGVPDEGGFGARVMPLPNSWPLPEPLPPPACESGIAYSFAAGLPGSTCTPGATGGDAAAAEDAIASSSVDKSATIATGKLRWLKAAALRPRTISDPRALYAPLSERSSAALDRDHSLPPHIYLLVRQSCDFRVNIAAT